LLTGTTSVVFALLLSIVGIGFVIWQTRRVLAYDQGNQTMRDIAAAIQDRRFGIPDAVNTPILAGFVVVVAAGDCHRSWTGKPQSAFVSSAQSPRRSAGYLGMFMSPCAPTCALRPHRCRSLNDGLRVAFSSGSVMGMAVVSFGLLGHDSIHVPAL
jgi:K(+)-stimulated pyrophosphate-energized sodium pump